MTPAEYTADLMLKTPIPRRRVVMEAAVETALAGLAALMEPSELVEFTEHLRGIAIARAGR